MFYLESIFPSLPLGTTIAIGLFMFGILYGIYKGSMKIFIVTFVIVLMEILYIIYGSINSEGFGLLPYIVFGPLGILITLVIGLILSRVFQNKT